MNKSLITQNIKKNYQLLENNQYGLAEQNALNLLKENPNNHEIYNLIGDIHYKQNNFASPNPIPSIFLILKKRYLIMYIVK